MINLTVVIDNDEAISKLRELQKVAKTTTSSIVDDSERMDASWQQMKSTLMSLTAGVSFGALAKQVVQVRGEVQQLEVAFETMLGSKDKASKLMSESVELAAKTPFGLQDVTNATKMLLAYGSAAEEVTGEIKMLGNIASGLSIPLNDLVYLYGTTRTQGRMFTQDLRQFMGRGIPLAEELAKQFGVTKDKVGKLVTAGRVGFDDMAKALQAMTSEGGQFNDLMEKQSQTISGQISNLEDSIYQMFNAIGESSEGVISDLISGASWVVEHYQEILKVLKYIIVAYGSYKAALILVAAAQRSMALASSINMYAQLAKYITSAKDAMLLFNMAVKANPFGILLSVIATIGVAIWNFSEGTEEAAKQMGKLEQAAYNEYLEVNRLANRLNDANIAEDERKKLLGELKSINPDIVSGLANEANITAQLTANLKDYNKEQIKKIQLASLDDKMQDEIKKVGDAKLEYAEYQKELSDMISDYQAKRAAGESPNIDVSGSYNAGDKNITLRDYNEQSKAIVKNIVKTLDKILLDRNTTDAYKALEIDKLFGGSINLESLNGLNFQKAIDNVNASLQNMNEAEKAFDEYVQEDNQLREIIGKVAKDTKSNADNTKSYAEAFKEAEQAYLSAQKELAKANSDREAGKSTISTEKYQELVAKAESTKKDFQKLGGVTIEKSTKAAEKNAKRLKEINELEVRLQLDANQSVIDAMKDGTEKKIAQINLDYEKRKAAIDKEKASLIEKQGSELTEEQQLNFTKIYDNALNQRNKDISDVYKAEFEEMQNFLKEYGTFHQRKLAIAAEYDKKIASATSDNEKKRLEMQKSKSIASMSTQELTNGINWEVIFGDFGSMFKEYVRPEFEALGEYIKTDEFKEADASDKQTIIEAYEKLEEVFTNSSSSFSKLGANMQALSNAQNILKQRQEEYSAMYDRLMQAQRNYEEALKSGNEAQIKSAEANLNLYTELTENASENLVGAENDVTNANNEVRDSAKILGEAFDDTAKGLASLKSASISTLLPALEETAKGLSKFDGKLGEAAGKVAKSLGSKLSEIVGFILNILDILKDGISGLVVPIIDAILNAVSGIIGDILNFKDGLFRKLGESLYTGIIGIFRSILTLGGWFDWFGDGESDKTLSADIERLTEVNAALKIAIDHLADVMDYTREAYEEQKKLLQQSEDNTKEMMSRSAQAYSNGFLGIGGTHSSSYYINEGMSKTDWERISKIVDKTIASSADFFNLTSEEMRKIAEEAPDLYGKIKDLANDGYKDASQYMDAYIEYAKQIEELENQYNEFLTNTSYDQFRSEFKNALLDMEMSSKDFADNFNKMLVNSIAEALITTKYEEAIKELYNKWASYMEGDGTLSEDELADIERDREQLYNNIEQDRDFLNTLIGISSGSQQSVSRGFQAMSQETGSELNGRFTAIQGAVYGISESVNFIKSISQSQLTQLSSIDVTLGMIHNDTILIEGHTRRLESIDKSLISINKKIEAI